MYTRLSRILRRSLPRATAPVFAFLARPTVLETGAHVCAIFEARVLVKLFPRALDLPVGPRLLIRVLVGPVIVDFVDAWQ